MQWVGRAYATTPGLPEVGHSLVQGQYVVAGRHYLLAPQLCRQTAVCQADGVPFRSKFALMVKRIRPFAPVPGTRIQVLLDSWYCAKAVWRAARARHILSTSGLKANRALRVPHPDAPSGWRWQTVTEYAASLPDDAYTAVSRPTPEGNRTIYAHVVQTRVRKLSCCQVVILRDNLTAPVAQACSLASSDLAAALWTLLVHITARWEVEVFFADTKDALGLDHYQLMTATALVRFWTLMCAAYSSLAEEQARAQQVARAHVTIGDVLRNVQRDHQRHLLRWRQDQFQDGVSLGEADLVLSA